MSTNHVDKCGKRESSFGFRLNSSMTVGGGACWEPLLMLSICLLNDPHSVSSGGKFALNFHYSGEFPPRKKSLGNFRGARVISKPTLMDFAFNFGNRSTSRWILLIYIYIKIAHTNALSIFDDRQLCLSTKAASSTSSARTRCRRLSAVTDDAFAGLTKRQFIRRMARPSVLVRTQSMRGANSFGKCSSRKFSEGNKQKAHEFGTESFSTN